MPASVSGCPEPSGGQVAGRLGEEGGAGQPLQGEQRKEGRIWRDSQHAGNRAFSQSLVTFSTLWYH